MFRKQDFKKIDLLGSGKKHTKIYKVQHLQTNKIYALKEIEAKTLDKLNEYKEEAVQLSKVQNHPNVIKFFGYYFTETMYNTYRLGLITEYMDHTRNLEVLYRKKKRANQSWKENELITFLFSMISTCSFLQQKGICHRDIKPANLFIMENGECKVIDFGESKDYFYDPNDEDRNTYTVATIRGTPQYLSPILWKAHVIDGNSRYVEHNIYKSDVFSCGLVVCQMAIMNEISGFNNKTPQNDGEQLVKLCMQELESQYSQQFINILALMLIFDECNRPSFTEIEQLFIEHEKQAQNEVDKNGKPKRINELIKGQPNENVRIFSNNQIQLYNQQLPSYRNFFPVVYFKNKIFTFGGYDGNSKQQVKTCEYLDLKTNSWVNFGNLNIARSQAAACKINDNEILIFGGYNKEEGPLDSIEKYLIKENKFEIVQNLKMPTSLRRFKAVQVGKNTALILGGQTKLSLDSQQVYKLNYETKQIFELQSLEKGGIIENDVLIDKDNNLHIFIEHNNGTSPHSHIKYHYDSNASQYQTQQDI